MFDDLISKLQKIHVTSSPASLDLVMADTSSTKRHKTGNVDDKMLHVAEGKLSLGDMPVEIFGMITQYLPRSSVQNMRLVNKDVEKRVSSFLFRTVVVPFRPEIFGVSDNGREKIGGGVNVMLLDKGMRVFQGFGKCILKFAMSFEIDIAALTYPPMKSHQVAVTTFWGIYRWPSPAYNRFHMLEGLEQTADKTRTMAEALQFVDNARELALSLDSGLGWLAGPDHPYKVPVVFRKPKVFGCSRFLDEVESELSTLCGGKASRPYYYWPTAEPATMFAPWSSANAEYASAPAASNAVRNHADTCTPPLDLDEFDLETVQTYKHILLSSGYTVDTVDAALAMLLDSERPLARTSRRGQIVETTSTNPSEAISMLRAGSHSPEITSLEQGLRQTFANQKAAWSRTCPLKPSSLKTSQKEMLLEVEWAQRAFMQSWTIAIVDGPKTFDHITTLTIARLSQRHLSILMREEFWDRLESLTTFSLAIIPDWRDISKSASGLIEDTPLKPSQAVASVYMLLQNHISTREHICELNFEWLCGGEAAAGQFARNQLILPAPLIANPEKMLDRAGTPPEVLSLPFVKNLGLKNCWSSPHVFLDFTQKLRAQSLERLTLQSMSLTVPMPDTAPAPQLGTVQAPQALQGNAFDIANMLPPSPQGSAPRNPRAWLKAPPYGTWSYIIDNLTPGPNLADIRYSKGLSSIPEPRAASTLRAIVLDSCGYVKLKIDLDQSRLDGALTRVEGFIPSTNLAYSSTHYDFLKEYMMKAEDHLLGSIVSHIQPAEAGTLYRAWQMTAGWSKKMTDELAASAAADGVRQPGKGRIKGTVRRTL